MITLLVDGVAKNLDMKKVLVVDDDHAVLEVLEETLKYENFDVKILSGTSDIFSDIDDCRPDVILMDYVLAGINGGEWSHRIKTNPLTSHIPIIMTTAYPKALNSLNQFDYDAFIEKPYDLSELISTVQNFAGPAFSPVKHHG